MSYDIGAAKQFVLSMAPTFAEIEQYKSDFIKALRETAIGSNLGFESCSRDAMRLIEAEEKWKLTFQGTSFLLWWGCEFFPQLTPATHLCCAVASLNVMTLDPSARKTSFIFGYDPVRGVLYIPNGSNQDGVLGLLRGLVEWSKFIGIH